MNIVEMVIACSRVPSHPKAPRGESLPNYKRYPRASMARGIDSKGKERKVCMCAYVPDTDAFVRPSNPALARPSSSFRFNCFIFCSK